MSVLPVAVVALSAAGLVIGAVVGISTRHARVAASCTLECWTAAGLLALAEDSSWTRIATAAVVISVRRIVGHQIL
jgi:hypothetical protein